MVMLQYDCWTVECDNDLCERINNESNYDDVKNQCLLSRVSNKYEIFDGLFQTDPTNMAGVISRLNGMNLASGIAAGHSNNQIHAVISEFSDPVEKIFSEPKTWENQPMNIIEESYSKYIRDLLGEVLNPNNLDRCQKETRCKWIVST